MTRSDGFQQLRGKTILTTQDAARVCSASISSIKNWIAKGALTAFRTPGGQFRIQRADLDAFLRAHGMPNPLDARERRTLVVIDPDPHVGPKLAARLEPSGWHVLVHTSGLGGLLAVALERPAALLLDFRVGDLDAYAAVAALRAAPPLRGVVVVAYAEDEDEPTLRRLAEAADAVVAKSARTKTLLDALG